MKRPMRRLGGGLLVGLGTLVLLAILALLIVTNTHWGREQVRSFAEARLNEIVDGRVEIGRLDGNLILGGSLHDLSIVDPEGRPFVTADEIAWRHSLSNLLRRRIVLTRVDLGPLHLVLDQRPGEDWNFARIFPLDPDAELDREPDEAPGFGDWIELRELRGEELQVTVRMPWEPDPEMSAGEREERVRQALAGETLEVVADVPEGLQSIMEFRVTDSYLPHVVIADPETDEISVAIARMSGLAEPFRAPVPGVIEDLSALIRIGPESLVVEELTLSLPASQVAAHAVFVPETAALQATVDAHRLTLDDVRFLYPPLPAGISGEAAVAIQLDANTTRANLRELDLRIGEGRLEGRGVVEMGERIVLDDAEFWFDGIRTRFLEEAIPELAIPEHGELSGHVAASSVDDGEPQPPALLDGRIVFRSEAGHSSVVGINGGITPGEVIHLTGLTVSLDPLRTELVRAVAPEFPLTGDIQGRATLDGPLSGPLNIDGVFAHRDPTAGTSRVSASGQVAFRDELGVSGGIVRLEPLQVALLREVDPELPVAGTIEGVARLDGTLEGGMRFDTELLHRQDEDQSSRVLAQGEVATAGDGRLFAEVELVDVSLLTAGRFAPGAQLRGSLDGEARIHGTFQDLAGALRLDLPGGGLLESEWAVDRTGRSLLYRVDLRLDDLDLSALSGRIQDETSIAGSVHAQGEGTDPAELSSELSAELVDDAPWGSRSRDAHPEEEGPQEAGDELAPRRLTAHLAADQGLATVHTLTLGMPSARFEAQGTFGLTTARSGTLAYRASVDSLHVLEALFPADPGLVEPRPAVREAAVEIREEELAQIVRDAQVEYLATGDRPPLPELEEVPGLEGIPRDHLAGSLEISGVLTGHVGHLEVEGNLRGEELVFLGNRIERAAGRYGLTGVALDPEVAAIEPRPALAASIDLESQDLYLAGFHYDRIAVNAAVHHGEVQTGELALSLQQDQDTGIRVQGGFELAENAGKIRLDELTLEFADASYRLPRTGVVRWDEGSVEMADLTLESDLDARLTAAGTLPLREADVPQFEAAAADAGALELSVEAFELAHLARLAQMEEGLAGRLDLDVELVGTLEQPVIWGNARLTGVTFDDHPLPEVHTEIDYGEEILTLEAWAIQEHRRVFVAEARLPLDLGLIDASEERLLGGSISVDARLQDLRLEGLDALIDEIDGISGGVNGELRVGGSYGDPEVAGEMELTVPTMFIEPLGIRVNDLTGAVSLRDQVLVVDSVVAYSGGPIRASGQVDLAELATPRFDLELQATDARMIHTDDLRARVDAQIEITGPLEEVLVTGEVRTREGVIRIPSTNELAEPPPLDLTDPSLRARLDPRLVQEIDRLVDTSPLLENLQVDLDLLIARGMWVRSPDLNVEFSTPPAIGPLQVRMNGVRPEDISLEGTVQTERGEYEFMGRRFNLSRGTATFVEGATLEPLIRLTAEHEVQLPGREPFDIRIVMDGTPAELDTHLESTAEPPLSQTDLLSFVVFGRDAGSLLSQPGSALSGQGSSGGPLVGAVASRAAQQFATVGFNAMLEQVEAETSRALGLDVLNIRPAELPAEISTGEFADLLRGTEFEAGRYLTSRLFVSGQARPTFVHPGARMDYETEHGWVWRVTWRPRFLPAVPTLLLEEPDRASVFGSLIFREWRF